MRLSIRHTSQYVYSGPVSYALQQVRLTPKNRPQQKVVEWSIELTNAVEEAEFDDHLRNRTLLVRAEADASEITIACSGIVETENDNGIAGSHDGLMPLWYFSQPSDLTTAGTGVRAIARSVSAITDPVEQLHQLSGTIRDQIAYKIGHTDACTTAEEAAERGAGVCQDHAHVFLTAARHLGFPARYVSGYLMLNDRIQQDATHAWAEAHVPELGWVGFDISNGISPDERYIRVATGLDYRGAAPIRGLAFGDHSESLAVQVEVQQQDAQRSLGGGTSPE